MWKWRKMTVGLCSEALLYATNNASCDRRKGSSNSSRSRQRHRRCDLSYTQNTLSICLTFKSQLWKSILQSPIRNLAREKSRGVRAAAADLRSSSPSTTSGAKSRSPRQRSLTEFVGYKYGGPCIGRRYGHFGGGVLVLCSTSYGEAGASRLLEDLQNLHQPSTPYFIWDFPSSCSNSLK